MGSEEAIYRWLEKVGLVDSDDPDAVVLIDCARELDWLDGKTELDDRQLVAARRTVRASMNTARRGLQKLLDRQDSQASRKRHQLVYGRVVDESFGWIDLDLLPTDLRAQVVKHLYDEHGLLEAEIDGEEVAL